MKTSTLAGIRWLIKPWRYGLPSSPSTNVSASRSGPSSYPRPCWSSSGATFSDPTSWRTPFLFSHQIELRQSGGSRRTGKFSHVLSFQQVTHIHSCLNSEGEDYCYSIQNLEPQRILWSDFSGKLTVIHQILRQVLRTGTVPRLPYLTAI